MAEEEVIEESEGGGGGKSKLIIIIVVALLLIVGIAVGAMMFLGGGEEPAEPGAEGENKEQASQMEEEISNLSQKEEVKLENPVFTPPKSYTVNLRDGKHYLQIELSAAMEDPNALMFLAGREPMIDDMIISMLQDLTTEDLRSRGGMELLKRELFKKVNGMFTQEYIEMSESKDRTPVKKVLITKFILN